MKKILLLVASFATLPIFSQVKSVTMISAVSLVDSAKITHYDSTTNPTDTFYTRQKTAKDTLFSFTFPSPYVMRTGSGTYVDILMDPLVPTGDTTFVVTEIANDSLFTTNVKISDFRMVIPKQKPVLPTVSVLHKNPTTDGGRITISFTAGNADSVIIKREIWLDSLHKYSGGSKKWTKMQNGTFVDTLKSLNDNDSFYMRYTITNYVGYAVGTDTEDLLLVTLPKSRKPWIAKDKDPNLQRTTSSIDFSGKALSYGLPGTIFARYGKNGTLTQTSLSVPLTGVGEEIYAISLTGLDQNTTYFIRVYIQNSLGVDSMDFSETTDGPPAKTFTLAPISANGDLGFIRFSWSRTIQSPYKAWVSRAVFEDNTGTVAVENTTRTDVYTGNGAVSEEFHVPAGTYWVACWGNSEDGQLVSMSKLIEVTVAHVATGIAENYRLPLVLYPNPVTDIVHINTESSLEETVDIYDQIGKLVHTQVITDTATAIDVSGLTSGMYVVRIQNKSGKFFKN